MVVWDRGTWVPADDTDPAVALEDGELHFDLHGDKLVGRFALVRRGKRGAQGRGAPEKEQWLLVHKHDEHAAAIGPGAGAGGEPVTDAELSALDALGTRGTWSVGGYEVALTNLDKVLFPGTADEPPATKRDLLRYYARMAPFLLPHLAGRLVNLHRYPDGVTRPGFWQKEVPDHAPDWVRRWHNVEADPGETQCYAVLDHVGALAWAANYGAVELHPWEQLDDSDLRPDRWTLRSAPAHVAEQGDPPRRLRRARATASGAVNDTPSEWAHRVGIRPRQHRVVRTRCAGDPPARRPCERHPARVDRAITDRFTEKD